MTQLIAQRPIGTIPAGAAFETDSDNAAKLIASGAATEVSPLAGAGADVRVRHRAAQEAEEAAVKRAQQMVRRSS